MKKGKCILLLAIVLITIKSNAQITILGNGNVGIKTDTTSFPLEVIGTVRATNFIGLGTSQWSNLTSGPAGIFYNSGNVGIGSTMALAPLQVNGTSYFNGDVGIGTYEPVSPLEVIGTSYFNGNVGIGTSAPVSPLEVVGTSYFNGNVGIAVTSPTANLQLGSNASWNSGVSSLGSDFRVCGYNSGTPYAFLSARDNSGTNSIGYIFRTQLSGNVNNVFYLMPNGYVGINNGSPSYMLDLGTAANALVRAYNVTPSDARLKTNINNLSNALASLVKFQGKTYNLSQQNIANQNDTVNAPNNSSINPSFYTRGHFGFLAQDVQKLFPQLVYADKDSMLGIDYISIIPIIVESIKELTTQWKADSCKFAQLNQRIMQDSIYFEQQMQTLLNQIIACCGISKVKSNTSTTSETESDQIPNGSEQSNPLLNNLNPKANTNDGNVLYQNSPNPFNLSTTIGYHLASDAMAATIYVYNMLGTQIKSFPIYSTGNGSISINGSDLSAGMYLYALVVDGKIIDTKKMILTN